MSVKQLVTQENSEFNQESFVGGMNLLADDTRLATNQYRILFNARNRYDRLDLILSSQLDALAPKGIKQEMVTFGNYEILFVAGSAYYKYYTANNWVKIAGFSMSSIAPRYWTVAIPVSETNYYRVASSVATGTKANASANGPINTNNVAGAAAGNLPGLLVQDNINQPQFIFLNSGGIPTARITQKFSDWRIGFTTNDNVVVGPDSGTSDPTYDLREYVPIGNAMAWVDGILYTSSQDTNFIYRSVSGRPLDFVVNVTNTLATASTTISGKTAFWQLGGGDATTTAYSVGVGGITTLRGMSDGSLFVGASNANFSVAKNKTPGAPTLFGEYTFLRTFLFNAVCLSDRAIFDTLGDTRFITLVGVRSFNAVEQTNNEGRNSLFTSIVQPAFDTVIQDARFATGILFNDYELYAMQTVFGPAIAVYDTVNADWVGFDVSQTNGKRIKILSKIELSVQALFAVTEDDQVYRLYVGPGNDVGTVRGIGVCSNILYANQNIKMADPRYEIKPTGVRVILNGITKDCQCTMTLYVNNRLSMSKPQTKQITYGPPVSPSTGLLKLPDVDSQLMNLLFTTNDAEQGWKTFFEISWTNGYLSQYSMELTDQTPQNPLNSQGSSI